MYYIFFKPKLPLQRSRIIILLYRAKNIYSKIFIKGGHANPINKNKRILMFPMEASYLTRAALAIGSFYLKAICYHYLPLIHLLSKLHVEKV